LRGQLRREPDSLLALDVVKLETVNSIYGSA
jgi:hypothetical protein